MAVTPAQALAVRAGSVLPEVENVGWGVKKMHTPSSWTFWLSVILVVLAIVATFVRIPVISQYAFWVAVLGYVVLVFGCLVKTT